MEIDKRAVLVTVSLTSFLTPFSGSSFNIALPSIAAEYGLDAISMSWASLAYLLATAMFLIPFGKLADMYGRKKVYMYGIIVFTVSSALLGLYPSSTTLVVFRALQGIGSAMVFGTSLALLVSIATPEERGSMLGTTIAMVYIGLSVGPSLGGLLTKNFGWRSIFLVNVGLGALIVFLLATRLKGEFKDDNGGKFDSLGSLVFSAMLFALMYGMSKLPTQAAYLPVAVGVVLMGVFAYIEGKVENPVLDLNVFKENKAYSLFNLTALLNFSATFSITFLLSMYLQYIKGLDPQQAGAVMIASPIVQAIMSPIAGRLSDRILPSKLATVGMGVTGLAMVPLVFLNPATSTLYITGALVVLGLGLSLFSSPNTNAIMSSVPNTLLGVASSTVGTMRLTGQMLSQGIAMTLIAVNLGSATIVPELYPELLTSISGTFAVFAVLCGIGVVASYSGTNAVLQIRKTGE